MENKIPKGFGVNPLVTLLEDTLDIAKALTKLLVQLALLFVVLSLIIAMSFGLRHLLWVLG